MNDSLLQPSRIALLIAMLLIARPVLTRAEIYEWDDGNGRHYADSLEAIPKDSRAQARLVVKEEPPAPAPPEPATDQAAQREEQASNSFASGWDTGFEAGWQAGLQAAVAEQPECPIEPEVVVLQSAPPVTLNVPAYDPTGAFYRSPYAGTVTVPFDGGRSFGLTRREQMQRLQGR
jgi:hypothetical protein